MNVMKLEIKKKDLLYIIVTAVILVAVATMGYQQLAPAGGSEGGITVEVVQPVGASFNTSALDHLRDENASKNFTVPVDLGTGVGTPTPFGQL